MQKNNIRMEVQSISETAAEFAERLERTCYNLCLEYKDKLHTPPIVFLTSASDGRQTAALQFITSESDKTNEATFNGFHLRMAYDKFKESFDINTHTDVMIEFLLKQSINDYVSH